MNKEPSNIKKTFGDFSPKLVQITDDVLFGDVWERSELSKCYRSLVTVTALIAGGNTEQLPFHLKRAKENGVTEAELIETITHLAFYCGWPRPCPLSRSPKKPSSRSPNSTANSRRLSEWLSLVSLGFE